MRPAQVLSEDLSDNENAAYREAKSVGKLPDLPDGFALDVSNGEREVPAAMHISRASGGALHATSY